MALERAFQETSPLIEDWWWWTDFNEAEEKFKKKVLSRFLKAPKLPFTQVCHPDDFELWFVKPELIEAFKQGNIPLIKKELHSLAPEQQVATQVHLLVSAVFLNKENIFQDLMTPKSMSVIPNYDVGELPAFLPEFFQAKGLQDKVNSYLSPKELQIRDMALEAFKITNLWKLKGIIPASSRGGHLGLYGGHSPYFLELLDEHSQSYFEKEAKSNQAEVNYFSEVYQAISQMKNNSRSNPKELAARWQKGELISLPTGWRGHDINICFLKTWNFNYIAISNRGEERQQGLEFYKLPSYLPKEKMEELFFHLLYRRYNCSNKKYILQTMKNYFSMQPVFQVSHHPQKFDNCIWISHIGAVEAILLLLKCKAKPSLCTAFEGLKKGKDLNKDAQMALLDMRHHYKALHRKIKLEEKERFISKYGHSVRLQELLNELHRKYKRKIKRPLNDKSITYYY